MALLDDGALPVGWMMGRFKRLYPFLFMIIPVLNVVARNPGGSTLGDVGAVALAMLVAGGLAYGIAALVLRSPAGRASVPLVVLAVIIGFYSYPAVRSAYGWARDVPSRLALTVAAALAVGVAVIAGIRWLSRRPSVLDRVHTFLALTAVLVVAFLGVRIAGDQLRARSQLRASALVAEMGRPIVADSPAPARGEPRPDIYLIVLDEYANSTVLRERFGFDNHVFEDSLRKLGFTVPALVRSNYFQTLLSIPSLLNFSHLTALGEELGPGTTDPAVPNFLVENNRTAAFLKGRGYRFVFFPSQWWISTRRNRNADSEFSAWNGFNPVREASRSDLRRAFVSRTPLALLHRDDPHDADFLMRTLAGLEELAADSGATFAFAHILNPHNPYVFDASCRTHPTRPGVSWRQGREKAYLGQVQCLNRLLLGTVTRLLERSSPPPLILLVGDHGTNSLGFSSAPSAEAVSPAQARERFGAFGAFYLPAVGEGVWPDSVTLVNVLPRVLNHYFDAGIQLQPDSLYMSLEKTPYDLVPVDPASLAPPM